MKRRIAYILAVITLVSLVLVFATQRSEPARSTGTDTYSDGALGHEGMRDVMKELGVHVLVDRRGAYAFADAPVLFVEPSPRAVDLHGDVILLHHVLLQRAQLGHDSVLVLPKWQPGLEREGPVSRAYKPNVEEVLAAALPSGLVELRREDTDVPETAMLREWTVPGRYGPRKVTLLERQTLRVHDRRAEVLLGSRRSALVVRYRPAKGGGSIFVVSDPDVLHNFNHHRGDHAQIVRDLLYATDSDAMVIDEVFHGHAFGDTAAGVLGSTRAVFVVVYGFGLAALFLWAGVGKLRSPLARPTRSAECLHAASPVLAPHTGPTNPGLVGGYITMVVTDVADRLGVPAKASLRERARLVDELADRRGVKGGAVDLLPDRIDLPRSRRALLDLAWRAHALRERLLHLKGNP